jgi:hypothetical protein
MPPQKSALVAQKLCLAPSTHDRGLECKSVTVGFALALQVL